MWLYGGLVHFFFIFKCMAIEDELVSVDDVLKKFMKNITKMNFELLHNIKDAHKAIGNMDTEKMVALDEYDERNDNNVQFFRTLNNEPSGSFEAISINPKNRLNAYDVIQNTLKLHKRRIPEKHNQVTFKQKQRNSNKKQLNIWKTLPLKLNSLIQSYDENESFKSSKEDSKPLIIVLANSKRDSNNNDRSDIKEIESYERKSFLRDSCVTCVKAQVQKCYKALQEGTKKMCLNYKCKGSFKRGFKENSKKGCIAEFWADKDNKMDNKNNISAVLYINHPDATPRATRTFNNLNRGCEDEQDNSYPRSIEELLSSMTSANTAHRVNVLRNKYENACKRAVAKKCNKVCIAVINKTCTEHKCMKRQISTFKKDCRKSCANTFGVVKSSESDSGDDDEDYEDEESN